MRDSHSSGGSGPRSENEIIQIGSMLLCTSAVVVAFFSRAVAWGILLLPIAHLLFTAFATGSAKLGPIPELSGNANVMLRRWHCYYLRPCFWTAARAVGFAAPAVAIIGCFYGFYLGLPLGVAIFLLISTSPRFSTQSTRCVVRLTARHTKKLSPSSTIGPKRYERFHNVALPCCGQA